jgi:hypothetical protein
MPTAASNLSTVLTRHDRNYLARHATITSERLKHTVRILYFNDSDIIADGSTIFLTGRQER